MGLSMAESRTTSVLAWVFLSAAAGCPLLPLCVLWSALTLKVLDKTQYDIVVMCITYVDIEFTAEITTDYDVGYALIYQNSTMLSFCSAVKTILARNLYFTDVKWHTPITKT